MSKRNLVSFLQLRWEVRETWFPQLDLSWRKLIFFPCIRVTRSLVSFLYVSVCRTKTSDRENIADTREWWKD